jgi:hypothetical protein
MDLQSYNAATSINIESGRIKLRQPLDRFRNERFDYGV